MGEYFLVIIMCIAGACQSIHSDEPYTSYEACYQQSKITAEVFNKQYPSSQGQIFCLDKDQYKLYLNTTEEKIIGTES